MVVGHLNRFTVGVRLGGARGPDGPGGPDELGGPGGKEVVAHLPNSGRLRKLLAPGNRCFLRPAPVRPDGGGRSVGGAPRRTAYDLLLVAYGGGLVCVDARMPPDGAAVVFVIQREDARAFAPTSPPTPPSPSTSGGRGMVAWWWGPGTAMFRRRGSPCGGRSPSFFESRVRRRAGLR